jgi:hypothetical protein
MLGYRSVLRFFAAAGIGALAFGGASALNLSAIAQQPAPAEQPGATQPAQGATPGGNPAPTPDGAQHAGSAVTRGRSPQRTSTRGRIARGRQTRGSAKPPSPRPRKAGEITEDEAQDGSSLGKPLYLRGGYLDS